MAESPGATGTVPSAADLLAHAETVRGYMTMNLSEADTRAYLVDPLLRMLGYDQVGHLRREVSIPATKEFLDYQLFVDEEPRAIVEAKAMRYPLSDAHAGQCVQYASVLGVRWCLITNGLAWAVYDAHAKGPLTDKHVATVRWDRDADEVADAARVLALFSRAALATASPLVNLLTLRVVADELARADSPAVEALRRAIFSRFGERVSGYAVLTAVRQLTDGVASESHTGIADADTAHTPAAAGTSRVPERRSGLHDLVAAGALPADAVLETRVAGVTHLARLRDGQIDLNGQLYDSPSAASQALRGTARNGWIDWRYKGRPLADLRAGAEPTSRPAVDLEPPSQPKD